MKKFIVVLLLLIPLQLVIGQDKIITIQNDTIHCQILSVSPTHVLYEQKVENGFVVGKYIPIMQVLEYYRNAQLSEPKLNYTIEKQNHKLERIFMIGINPGRASMLTSDTDEENAMIRAGIPESDVDKYLKQIKNGWNFSGDVHYFLSDNFGLGAKYSLFFSSAQMNILMYNLERKEKKYIHYIAPSVVFRQWLDKYRQFQLIETFSIGYVQYKNEFQHKQYNYILNALTEGNTLGANVGLSANYYPLTCFSVGVNSELNYARIKKVDVTSNRYPQTVVKLDKENYIKLTRFNYSLSLRFHF